MTTLNTFRLLAVCLGVVWLFVGPATADVVTIEADRDNSIYEGLDTSFGQGRELYSGRSGFGLRRGLLRFDIAGRVPTGSTIESVELRMNVTGSGPSAQASDIYSLHRVLVDWGEAASGAGSSNNGTGAAPLAGDATWSFRLWDTDAWATPGGDFAPQASASAPLPYAPGPATIGTTAQLVDDVTGMLADPSANHGWILSGDENASRSARRFASREALSAASRPQLVVEYSGSAVESVEIDAARDTTLYSYNGSRSNGAGPELFSGETGSFGSRRALLAFDVAGHVPPGATIVDVSLRLHVIRSAGASSPDQLSSLHRLVADWGEGGSGAGSSSNGAGSAAEPGADATWTDRLFTVEPWAEPGGDFIDQSSVTFATPTAGAIELPSTPSMIADVSSWVEQPSMNFGWILRGPEGPSARRTARVWSSRERQLPQDRPRLRVSFALPDFDGDGLNDAVDEDDDNDGVADDLDADPFDPAVCEDLDGDGCDDCSVGVDGTGPATDADPANDGADVDADGLCDSGDNCVLVANVNQQDLDVNGVGDVCECKRADSPDPLAALRDDMLWAELCRRPRVAPDVIECSDALLSGLGLGPVTCELSDVADDPACARASRRLATLTLTICAGRASEHCPVDLGEECEAVTVGELIFETAAGLLAGECEVGVCEQ